MRFNDFELDLNRYELRRSDQRVDLQRVPMDLLILLAERRGALVTRDEIVTRLWSPDAPLDTERSINTAIRKIRQALGDDAGHPRFVETVVGKGYRFIAPVSPGPPAAAPPKRRAWWLVAAAVLAIAALAVRFGPPPKRALAMRITPFTGLPGLEATPSFSPDGTRVAYRWTQDDGSQHLYLKTVGVSSPVQLTFGPGRDTNPVWSRDGRSIAFLRRDSIQGMAVFVTEVPGSRERKIQALAHLREFYPSWSGNDKSLAVVDSEPGDTQFSIFLLDAESGRKRRLLTPSAAGTGDWAAAFSPDGRSLAFLRNGGSAQTSVLAIVPVDDTGRTTGSARTIRTDRADLVSVQWSPDGESLLCESRTGLVRIWKSGGGEQLPFPDAAQPSMAAGRLVYVHSIHNVDIFRIPGPGEKGAPLNVISSARMDGSPQYSPDGKQIVFVSDRTGSTEIWVSDSDGRHATQITALAGPTVGCPRWSPDGQRIAFDSIGPGRTNIFVVAAHGGAPRRVTGGDSTSVRPSWSRDGRWIYFGSNRSGHWEVWKSTADGTPSVQVTYNGGREAFEDSQGQFVYYTKVPPARGIWRLPVAGGTEELVTGEGSQGRWAIGEHSLYYLRGGAELEALDLVSGGRVAVPTNGLPLAMGTGGLLSIGPGGHSILVPASVRRESELMMVEGFR